MKLCPVCQYEEEQDSEMSCAICGSDLGSSDSVSASTDDEPTVETTKAIEETSKESESVE
ncbi:uncharacterized protein METZ01_LOCUS507436, partial [marine metagenome]